MTIASTNKTQKSWYAIICVSGLHLLACLAFLPQNFSWTAVGVAVLLHWLTGGVGITLGWHRLVSHRSFQVPKWLEYVLIFCGTLSGEAGPISWIGLHRQHHKYSDTPLDPHDSNKGFWWSHVGWFLQEIPANADIPRFTQDIRDDRFYQFCEKYFIHLQVALAAVLFLIGDWSFVVWGIFVRTVAVLNCTWFVNSATHKFGYQTYPSDDQSRNCWWVAVVSYGEGWHNNHHAFQFSARHGLEWWEIDLTWIMIRTLQILGLATDIKLPPKDAKPIAG
ncbi:MAG: acyl-CoA desaturase [Synechococcaceae cyanobacterium RL_1_2]|nr:acyl-CoA desaturase [Synechococcaceae cyanobacterium RL_1_2]